MTRGRKPGLFDEIHGKGALARLRLALDNTTLNYGSIARRFRISRQRVGQIAEQLGIDGRHRQRERTLSTVRPISFLRGEGYPHAVKAVAGEIELFGMTVAPYRPPHYSNGYARKRTLLIDGVPCQIHCRIRASKTRPRGRDYVLFRISNRTKEAKAAVFAFWRRGKIKLYVIPTRELKKVSTLWLPADGRYAENHNIKPKRDWTVYEGAWHLLKRRRQT